MLVKIPISPADVNTIEALIGGFHDTGLSPFLQSIRDPPVQDHSTLPSRTENLEDKRSTLRLLVTTQLKVLASLQAQLCLCLALCALESQDDLLRGLGFLVEHGFCLTSVSGLLAVVTALSLGEQGGLEDV
jgi:hypothetical protein